MLVTLASVLKKAQAHGYAVGAFNVNNLETAQAIIQAACEVSAPVIMQTSEGAIEYAGMDYLSAIIRIAAKSSIPVVLHLDHGKNLDIIRHALRSGYTSVMYDGSHLSFEDNVHRTRQVVQWARQYGSSVEAELGRIPGKEDLVTVKRRELLYTDPESAREFVQKTGCAALAVSIGTAHGPVKSRTKVCLDYALLKRIRAVVAVPLVLHGASSVRSAIIRTIEQYGGAVPHAQGVSDQAIKRAVLLGICKVNTDTDLRLAATSAIRKALALHPEEIDMRGYIGVARDVMKHEVMRKIRLLGSADKA
ncbi:MAG: Fructose-1,6-bisphosphate aldolase, class II [Parcubacteria group bacterium GW2011_GWA2_43_13]|nr:MAG: Fructose-1,6-bisphosphate aldolase, class II [Parcubacteria group bacterium GW2011_GWA2_43_13]OGY68570.1 MAG: hypothetical protein A3B94_00755 [Candidatus Jacksonbacteria bacterium RIFCSPHIGHO2_02_FULL_43_10]OGY70566.1 MAG: hypothetical protein A2986_02550 [Candidatus Jacksonbacteria bacterium RIFCSPLOWO2_01_FULL_44_13]HAZ16342.1 tagatose-bisphosphate aldolase [Candidatus Jacksonbacteria bacterium]